MVMGMHIEFIEVVCQTRTQWNPKADAKFIVMSFWVRGPQNVFCLVVFWWDCT